MLNVLILGSGGMAGSAITDYLNRLNKYTVITTSRTKHSTYNIDIEKDLGEIGSIITGEEPDIIINCIGLLVKPCQDNHAKAIYINSYFPHYLEYITKNTKTKVIHLSTDCVNIGTKGNYSETDIPDEVSNYGKTKALGEIVNKKDLTLRLSIIGSELKENGTGLFHWFMQQKGSVGGFTKVIWNGITCYELAKQIDKIMDTNLTGLYHLVPDFKISKYELLQLIAKVFNKDITIIRNNNFIQDKTLVNNRKEEYNPNIPCYKSQLQEMKEAII